MEELSHVLTKDFISCVHVRFYFFTAAHFHLAANISHFLTAAMKFLCFSSNEIRLPSSFSVILMSVNIKNNVERRDFVVVVVVVFITKSSGGHAIFFRCIWVAIPVDWVTLYWCACGAKDGRSLGQCTVTWLPNFLGWALDSQTRQWRIQTFG